MYFVRDSPDQLPIQIPIEQALNEITDDNLIQIREKEPILFTIYLMNTIIHEATPDNIRRCVDILNELYTPELLEGFICHLDDRGNVKQCRKELY